MAKFKVKYVEEVYMIGYIEAETEEEAMELAEHGSFLDSNEIDSGGIEVIELEEM